MRQFFRIFIIGTLSSTASLAHSQDLTLVNVAPDTTPALSAAVQAGNWTPHNAKAQAKTFEGPLVLWEASAGGDDISPETAKALGEYVRQGGSLLLTLSDNPGIGPFRLSFMLPTTAWHTQGGQSREAALHSGSATVAETDSQLFPPGTVQGLTVPFYFPIRPFHSVERGEERYEKFARSIPYLDLPVPAENSFWTRPLLNRDWQIRARGDDVGQTPLLLTGRYGAGRVAVFASSVKGMADTPQTRAFWSPVLRWLTSKDAAPQVAPPTNMSAPTAVVDRATRTLRVTLKNPTGIALPLRVLARLSTWEDALIGDVERPALVPANGQITVALPLPKTIASSYQALDFRDAFDVRLGVLSSDGANLLSESRVPIDLRAPLTLAVTTDNVRATTYPFKAPGPGILNFPNRMGEEINDYAYPPGQAINAHVTIANGVSNIAPLAEVRDETTPDNATTAALTDGSVHGEETPIDTIQAYGMWSGQAGKENVLSFTFPTPVTVSGVTLVGSPDSFRFYSTHNPGAVVVEADGKEVTRADGLDQKFGDEFGSVSLSFQPQQVTTIRVRLPWVDTPIKTPANGDRRREAPWLGEVRIEGSTAALPAAAQGAVSLVLRDALSGKATPVGTRTISINPGAVEQLSFSVTPPDRDSASQFYTLEASFAGQQQSAPFMVLQPSHPLQPLQELKPPSSPDMGFIVTRGFRNVFETGTGTNEIPPGWATPDDLIWAYSHQMKQLGADSRTQANRLYLSESDMRHYSTPWRNFPDGEYFYDIAPELLVERLKRDPRWEGSTQASLSHSDRWDAAPDVGALNGWQDFIGFDEYLRAQNMPGLQGRTRKELSDEIHSKYESRWQAWQLERYIHAIHNLRTAFAKEGKQLAITAQGSPLVPAKYEKELTETIRGQSDDSTWIMAEENIPLSVGRQMGVMAFNPGWAMSTLIQWGWDSAVLNNPHWHHPVGTTEPSRRHMYDRAWRGTIGWDGQYKSMHTYGYNQNGGVSFTMTPNDWQQWWRIEERQSLISPEAPLGAGIVISTAQFADPDNTSWSGSGGLGDSKADDRVRSVQRAVRCLQEAGISIPFAANAGTLQIWKGNSSLILLDLFNFSAEEVAAIATLKARGTHIVAFQGDGQLSDAAARLFGVGRDGSPTTGKKVGDLNGHALVAGASTLFIPGKADALSVPEGRSLFPLLKQSLDVPITFPTGTAGYGFTSQGRKFIVVEDWREEGRTIAVRLRATTGARSARAVDVNSHKPLTVRRDGADWIIEMPIRPGDGALVAVEEAQ